MKRFHKGAILNILALIATYLKYIILCTRTYYINIDTMFDSHLQVKQAAHILAGNWLGTYDKFAMCKNPGFPMFLALINVLHISYPFAVLLLQAFSVGLLVFAFKPVVKNSWARLIMYCFILFGPFDYEVSYPYRNMVTPWIALVIVAAFVGIWLRVCECRKNKSVLSNKEMVLFGSSGFLFTGWLWILREDSMWILPFVCAAIVLISIQTIILKEKIKKKILILSMTVSSILGIVVFTNMISIINYNHYGVYATNDRMATFEAKVLGDLILIDDGTPMDQDVWVSDGTLELAKEASPTFASLDLNPFAGWPKIGDYSIWALRDSVTNSGYYIDAKSTDDLYKKIDTELNAAFDSGKLKKKNGIQLSDTSGIYTVSEMTGIVGLSFRTFVNHITYKFIPIPDKTSRDNVVAVVDSSDLSLYKDILKIDVHIDYDEESRIGKNPGYLSRNEYVMKEKSISSAFIGILYRIYRKTGVFLFAIVLIQLIVYLVKKNIRTFVILVGILATAFVNSYMVCLWAISRYIGPEEPIYHEYTYVEYLLIAVVEIVCLYSIIETIVCFIQKKWLAKGEEDITNQGEEKQ